MSAHRARALPVRAGRALRAAVLGLALAAAAGAAARASEPWFEDVAAAAGLQGAEGGRISFADLDGDGWPDLIVGCRLVYLNRAGGPAASGGRRFVAAGALFSEDAPPVQCVQVGDVDGDGHAEVFVGRMGRGSARGVDPALLRNELWCSDGRGGWRRLETSGLEQHAETTTSACFVDVDADGVLDLFVANAYVAYGQSLEAFADRLYRGRGDGTFEDVTAEAGLLGVAAPGRPDSRRPSYGVAHTDWNQDGRQDLLALSYGRQYNRLWRNDGGLRFTDVAAATGFDGDAERSGVYPPGIQRPTEPWFRTAGNTFDAAVADFDGDGDLDVFLAEIAHWWAGPSSDRSSLLENLGPEAGLIFRRRPELTIRPHAGPHWNEGDMHAGWLDADGDGLLDLLLASSDYPDEQLLRLYRQRPDHTFEDATERLGVRWRNATQISLADFDRDGALDIAVATSAHRLPAAERAHKSLQVGLLRNLGPARHGHRFLGLRLRGGGRGAANADAVGARVTVWAGGRRQMREVYGGLGHAGHRDDTTLVFGLGEAERVELLEVRWPDAAGTIQRFAGLVANRFYLLRQGGEPEPLGAD
ncbi:MAG: hypothetical protein KatS3mg102_0778 [Planctomycetota bacterium]|nr:MAG: hypothetical protein KatS3mg102_0778 [Planctomycetota bacterium]